MPAKRKPPRHFLFAILVPTKEEELEAKKIFQPRFEENEPFRYYWDYLRSGTSHVPFALVPVRDQGPISALKKTEEIVETLDPDHILVVGHGVGISKQSSKISTGTVVVSGGDLHTGTRRTEKLNPLRPRRVLPPSRTLSAIANDIASLPTCRNVNLVFEGDIVSGPVLEQDKEDKSFKNLVARYPKMVLYEMESGGVAEALWEKWSRDSNPDYLIIKGVSDTHDYVSKRKTSVAKNKQQREARRSEASRRAARFAKVLIEQYAIRIKAMRPTRLPRLLPKGINAIPNPNCAGVLHAVLPDTYSAIAKFNAERMVAEPIATKEKTLFTVCAFEPKELWDIVDRSYGQHNRDSKGRPRPGDMDDLSKWGLRQFPHFKFFSHFAKKRPNSCFRVLLLQDGGWNTAARLDADSWDLFEALNGEVSCWGCLRTTVPDDVLFLTDYCVIGEGLVLDYYVDSSTLVLSDVRDEKLKGALLKLKSLFDQERAGDGSQIFITPKKLREEARQGLAARRV
jgi:nucleoside phosphorylase